MVNTSKKNEFVSFIVPVYYEEDCIQQFINELTNEMSFLNYDYELIFIDDGSKDNTIRIIQENITQDKRIKLIELSYNQGKQVALTAGIKYSTGDLCIYMDPDLQDPPDEVIKFLNKINEGYDLVFGVRKEKKDTFINKFYSKIFWKTLNKFTGLNIPVNLAVMRVFNRKFADKFLEYAEQNRFIEGIFIHIGMNRTELEINQRERFAGQSKFNFKKKMNLAFDAIFDFSEVPLKMALKFGLIFSIVGFIALLTIIMLKVFIEFAAGWPSLICTIILTFGLNLMFLGVIGNYVGRIYKEVKRRPLFSIKNMTNF